MLQFDSNPHGTLRLVVSDELEAPPTYDVKELDYCQRRTECRFMDSQEMTWPWDTRAVTVTTYSKDKWQKLESSHATTLSMYVCITVMYASSGTVSLLCTDIEGRDIK